MGTGCFGNLEQLRSLYIEDNVPYIGNYSFSNCFALKGIRFPNTEFSIRDAGFSHCGIEEVVFPASLTSIGARAFYGCHSLQRIGFRGDKPYWGNRAFSTCTNFDCDQPSPKDKVYYIVNGTKGWDKVNGNMVVSSWDGIHFPTQVEQPDYTVGEWTDVFYSDWYASAVEYVVAQGLMNGMGNNTFAPQKNVTRAMVVTILWRSSGSHQTGSCAFTDVPEGQWYTQAVAWAAEQGIVNGVGNNRFDPEGLITREQLVTMFYRFAMMNGINTEPRSDLTVFPDAGAVSTYAQESISWAVATGLVNGISQSGMVTLSPQGNATRAQICVILQRYMEQQ